MKFAGRSGRTSPQRARTLADVLHQHRRRVRGLDRQFAGEHLISNDAERVNVCASVHFAVAHRLLGAHVRRRSDRDAGDREPRIALRGARDAEIRNQHVPRHAIDENVVGLHITVHDVTRVRIGERVRDFAQHRRVPWRRTDVGRARAAAPVSPPRRDPSRRTRRRRVRRP